MVIYYLINEYITQKEKEQLEEKKDEIETSLRKQKEIHDKLQLHQDAVERSQQLFAEKNQEVKKLREEGEKIKKKIETLNTNIPEHLREQIMIGGVTKEVGKLTQKRIDTMNSASKSNDPDIKRAAIDAAASAPAPAAPPRGHGPGGMPLNRPARPRGPPPAAAAEAASGEAAETAEDEGDDDEDEEDAAAAPAAAGEA